MLLSEHGGASFSGAEIILAAVNQAVSAGLNGKIATAHASFHY